MVPKYIRTVSERTIANPWRIANFAGLFDRWLLLPSIDNPSIPNTKGIKMAMPNLPPRPGTAPKNIPIGIARTINPISRGKATKKAARG